MAIDDSFVLTHASGLHAVARQLDGMHQGTIRTHNNEDDAQAVRLLAFNLVAICISVDDADVATHTAGLISQTHPCRAIVVYADPQPEDSEANIEADLSFQRALSKTGTVNAEHVRLNVSGEPAYHLTSVVTPLLVPDIPVYLWLVGAPPLGQAFGHDAIAICERLVIDTGEYPHMNRTLRTMATELQNAGEEIGLADLAWARTQTWREVLAQTFEGAQMRELVHHITQVEVESCGPQPSTAGWLYAGWLSDRLSWDSDGPAVVVAAAEVDGVPEHELSAVRVTCVSADHRATVTLERREQTLYSTIDVDGGHTAAQAMTLPDPDVAQLVGSLLEEGSDDPMYLRALHHAAAMLSK
jgi:glucose-6-phosphate dehydrogenase assembly protein OpcA